MCLSVRMLKAILWHTLQMAGLSSNQLVWLAYTDSKCLVVQQINVSNSCCKLVIPVTK